jgi:hypothetical protein
VTLRVYNARSHSLLSGLTDAPSSQPKETALPILDAALTAELWTALHQPFDTWVRTLAPVLAVGLSADPAVAAMSEMGTCLARPVHLVCTSTCM